MYKKGYIPLLILLLVASLSVQANTMQDDNNVDDETTDLTVDDLQEIKDICSSIASDSGLTGEDSIQFIDECIATETMETEVSEEPSSEDGDMFSIDEETEEEDTSSDTTD